MLRYSLYIWQFWLFSASNFQHSCNVQTDIMCITKVAYLQSTATDNNGIIWANIDTLSMRCIEIYDLFAKHHMTFSTIWCWHILHVWHWCFSGTHFLCFGCNFPMLFLHPSATSAYVMWIQGKGPPVCGWLVQVSCYLAWCGGCAPLVANLVF